MGIAGLRNAFYELDTVTVKVINNADVAAESGNNLSMILDVIFIHYVLLTLFHHGSLNVFLTLGSELMMAEK